MTDNTNRPPGAGQMGQNADRANQMGGVSGAGQQQQFESGEGGGRFRDQIREHMEVVGADGTHVGTVDCVKEDRLVLTRGDSTDQRHHRLPLGLVAGIEDGKVCLSANGDVAHYGFEDAEDGADWSGEATTGATATDTQTGNWSSTADDTGAQR